MSEAKLFPAKLPPLTSVKDMSSTASRNKLISMNGHPYHLNETVHHLPPPRVLRPYVDTKAGEIDTWPAHSTGQALSLPAAMLSNSKSLIVTSDDEGNRNNIIPKPRFLEQLENFLKSELRALGVTEITPSDLRLQAHREAFEYLIEDFKTYKPLLSAIKNEYEMMLAFQRQQIRQLEPLKQMLITVSEQCDQKIMAMREVEKQEIAELKAEKKTLLGKISTMVTEQRDLQEQVNRLQEKLMEEYQKYRDEYDARKLLIADINDLRYQQEDYMASKQMAVEQQETAEDPVTLKIALRKAREDEKAASQRLNEMIANYGDVIPRRDFEALEKQHKALEDQFEETQLDFRKLQAEHNALLDVQRQVTSQRDQFYIELETLKRSSTPRPNWNKCADYIHGGLIRWNELSEGKRSSELVDILLQEIGSGGLSDSSCGADYFDPLGTGPTVPKYMQCDSPVRNRRLGKRDVGLLIRDIWREKSASDAERPDGTRENMAAFVYSYLRRRFALEQMVIEWGYNLHDACQRYSHDENIGLFFRVLNNQGDEELYHRHLQLIHNILTSLTKEDAEQGNIGKLDPISFKRGLQTALPAMNEDDLATVIRAAEMEYDVKDVQDIDYKDLFTEDDEGRTGPFLDSIKKWVRHSKESFIADIKKELTEINPVSVDDLKRALSMADPEIDSNTMDRHIQWVFSVTTDKMSSAEPMEQTKVLERLLNGNVFRTWKKHN